MNKAKQFSDASRMMRQFAMILVLAVLWVAFHFLTEGTFLSMRNISNLFRQTAVVGVLSVGMAVCLIGGNFDLSVASTAGFIGAVAAVLIARAGMGSTPAILLSLLCGTLIGFWNGAWIAFAKVPAFIVTLGSQLIFKGLLLLICNGQSIAVRDELFLQMGQGYVPIALGTGVCVLGAALYILLDVRSDRQKRKLGLPPSPPLAAVLRYAAAVAVVGAFVAAMNLYKGIPIPVFILLAIVVAVGVLMRSTRFGRHVYAVGGNARAAQLSGLNNAAITMAVFVLMGLLASIAGVLMTMRLAAATPSAATGMELDAIAASVIGGVSLAGGSGSVANSIIGALVMASLTNGMSLLNINSDAQFVVRGLILILAVWFDVCMRRAKNR